MVKPIIKDVFFLGQKSEPATRADLQVGIDLQDTFSDTEERITVLALCHGIQSGNRVIFA